MASSGLRVEGGGYGNAKCKIENGKWKAAPRADRGVRTVAVGIGPACRLEVRNTADSGICATSKCGCPRNIHAPIIHPVFRRLGRMGF